MAEEPAAKPFYSVLVLAFVCSALVAGAAVGLRPMQEAIVNWIKKRTSSMQPDCTRMEKRLKNSLHPLK